MRNRWQRKIVDCVSLALYEGRILNTEFCIEEMEEEQINHCTKAQNEL